MAIRKTIVNQFSRRVVAESVEDAGAVHRTIAVVLIKAAGRVAAVAVLEAI